MYICIIAYKNRASHRAIQAGTSPDQMSLIVVLKGFKVKPK